MDDAIWVEQNPDGWELLVHIANVSRLVEKDSPFDTTAQKRVATQYYRDGNRPMLPRSLSEGEASLKPQESRSVLTIRAFLDTSLELQETSISTGSVVSVAKLSYDEIPDLVKKGSFCLQAARTLAFGLLAKRRDQGALVHYDLNNGWLTTEEGHLKRIERKEDVVGHIIIQELMVLANSLVAQEAVKNDIPILFRNHQAKAAAPDRRDLMDQINAAMISPLTELERIRLQVHMLLERAQYDVVLRGHYGLNLPAYTHFTSPIRRFADLANHRQIRAHLTGASLPYTREELEAIGAHINQVDEQLREKVSEKAKAGANERAQRRLERGTLRTLGAKGFERVVKVALRSGEDLPEELDAEYRERIREGDVPLICKTVLVVSHLKHPKWQALRRHMVERLSIQDAVSLLAQASQIQPDWGEVEYREGASVSEGVFSVVAGLGAYDGWGYHQTKKGAQQRAAYKLIASLCGFQVAYDNTEAPLAPPEAKDPQKPAVGVQNPVSALQEFYQQAGRPLPQYTFQRNGPDHVPTITCQCTFGGQSVEVQGRSKKAAKAAAAAKAIKLLHV
jgi:ribonuclease R